MIACAMYSEQVGVKRQTGGLRGERYRWYPRTTASPQRANSDGCDDLPMVSLLPSVADRYRA